MHIRPLTYLGDPVLRAVAAPVADPCGPDIAALAQDMAATMLANQGVGLAAPQLGTGQRVIVFHVPESRAGDETALPLHILINPQFIPLSDEKAEGLEGCLSLPGLRGLVPRYRHIGYRGLDLAGKPVEREATDFHARVVQHEIDHLDGVMYLDRMKDFTSLTHESVMRRQLQQSLGDVHGQEPQQKDA